MKYAIIFKYQNAGKILFVYSKQCDFLNCHIGVKKTTPTKVKFKSNFKNMKQMKNLTFFIRKIVAPRFI